MLIIPYSALLMQYLKAYTNFDGCGRKQVQFEMQEGKMISWYETADMPFTSGVLRGKREIQG